MQQLTAEAVWWPWLLWKWCNVWQSFLFCCSCTTNKHKYIWCILTRACFHNSFRPALSEVFVPQRKANSKSNSGGNMCCVTMATSQVTTVSTRLRLSMRAWQMRRKVLRQNYSLSWGKRKEMGRLVPADAEVSPEAPAEEEPLMVRLQQL